ncbi:CAP domain-containing protein [Candidatus Parcubacteria bacterium]|nr:CAP domain-containing protein [Candidatus Parcubacteria bacterium]
MLSFGPNPVWASTKSDLQKDIAGWKPYIANMPKQPNKLLEQPDTLLRKAQKWVAIGLAGGMKGLYKTPNWDRYNELYFNARTYENLARQEIVMAQISLENKKLKEAREHIDQVGWQTRKWNIYDQAANEVWNGNLEKAQTLEFEAAKTVNEAVGLLGKTINKIAEKSGSATFSKAGKALEWEATALNFALETSLSGVSSAVKNETTDKAANFLADKIVKDGSFAVSGFKIMYGMGNLINEVNSPVNASQETLAFIEKELANNPSISKANIIKVQEQLNKIPITTIGILDSTSFNTNFANELALKQTIDARLVRLKDEYKKLQTLRVGGAVTIIGLPSVLITDFTAKAELEQKYRDALNSSVQYAEMISDAGIKNSNGNTEGAKSALASAKSLRNSVQSNIESAETYLLVAMRMYAGTLIASAEVSQVAFELVSCAVDIKACYAFLALTLPAYIPMPQISPAPIAGPILPQQPQEKKSDQNADDQISPTTQISYQSQQQQNQNTEKKAKTDEEQRIAEEARKKAEEARIAAEQEAQKRQQEEALRRVQEEQRLADEQRKAQAAAEEAKRKEREANTVSCNGKSFTKCPEGKTFYCPPSGDAQCREVAAEKPNINISQLENQIHALINTERRNQSLTVLDWDGRLADIARNHSQDMAAKNYFAHTSPDGCDISCKYKKVNYDFSSAAENILYTWIYKSRYSDGVVTEYNTQAEIASSAVQWWMNSPGHRANILTPNFKNQGIGVAIANDGKVYVTENFSIPVGQSVPTPPVCTPNWQCSGFGSCINSQKTQTCTDTNNCNEPSASPPTTQSCYVVPTACTPNWQIGSWGTCTNSQQTRTVTDANSCGTITNKPTTTQSCVTQSQPQPPTAPSNSATTVLSSSRVVLIWQDNASNEAGFKIERKSSGGTYAQINMSGALSGIGSGGYYEDTGLSGGTNYCYRVRAYNSAGDSAYSNETCATTQITPSIQPTANTGFATNITSSSATLNGMVNPNGIATGAFFQWGNSSSFGNITSSQTIGNGNANIDVSANLTGLMPATAYYFRTVAVNGAGGTVFGATQTFTTSQASTPPVVPKPMIISISPNPVPPLNGQQWITINGTGLVSGLKIVLRTGNEVYTIPITSAGWVNSTQVKIYPNLTAQPAQWTVQAVNPDNKQSNMFSFSIITPVVNPILSLYPTSGVKGTLFTFGGTGFTPNGGITEVIFKPDGTNYPLSHYSANGSGNFAKTYNSATVSMAGTYIITWFDDTTGRQSNQVRETIN